MSNVSDNTSLLEFYTSISTLQTDAQLKVNALFENLKQEAIATLHKKLFNLSIQSNPLKTPEISTPEAEIVISKPELSHAEKTITKKTKEPEISTPEAEIVISKPELSHAENTIKKKTKEKAEAEPINVSMLPVKRRNKNRGKDTEIEYLDVFHQKAIKHKAMILKMYSSGINPKVISKLFTISVNSIHLLGNWLQVSDKLADRNRKTRQTIQKLAEKGCSINDISKETSLNKNVVSLMLEKIPYAMVIKSSSEKKRFTENVINKDTSKALIVRLTGVNTTKLNNWISHVNNSEPFSDDECFQSDGEYDRETKRNAIFEAYLTKNNSQAAAKFNVSNASNVSKWISDLEKCKRCGKEEDK